MFINSANDKDANLSTPNRSVCAQTTDALHRHASVNALARNGGWHMVFSLYVVPDATGVFNSS